MSDVTVTAGTREWAVVQAMQGKPVRHVTWSERIYAKTPGEVLYSRACPDGWELYSEPEPEIPRGTPVRVQDGSLWYLDAVVHGDYWLMPAPGRVSHNHGKERLTPLSVLEWHYKPELPPDKGEMYPALWDDGTMELESGEVIIISEHIIAWSLMPYLPPVTP